MRARGGLGRGPFSTFIDFRFYGQGIRDTARRRQRRFPSRRTHKADSEAADDRNPHLVTSATATIVVVVVVYRALAFTFLRRYLGESFRSSSRLCAISQEFRLFGRPVVLNSGRNPELLAYNFTHGVFLYTYVYLISLMVLRSYTHTHIYTHSTS